MEIANYSFETRAIIEKAQELAIKRDHITIEPWHLVHALLQNEPELSSVILKNSMPLLVSLTDKKLQALPTSKNAEIRWSSDAQRALIKAKTGDDPADVDDLWLALVDNCNELSQFLKGQGISAKEINQRLSVLNAEGKQPDQTSKVNQKNRKSLDRYAVNLNEMAQNAKLDPVIGRDVEIRRVIRILSRRTKNNPILIGEPGVGKTAVAEGIAQRIVSGDVPDNLRSKQLYSLDLGALVAGAKYKGEFEERLKAVINEVKNSDGAYLLFIDEIHTLVGAGSAEGSTDAANLLKPALARGELRAIGATTLNEYQKYFEKDKALERRFQKVLIDEPDRDSAIAILRGIKERYEHHHKVNIKDEAIIAAVDLSTRYISDRRLPDKAIDLIDESASKLRMEINSKPQELDDIDRKIMQLEIEKAAIKREKDHEKMAKLDEELGQFEKDRKSIAARWESEKAKISAVQEHKENIEKLNLEADRAERDGDYERVATLRYGKILEEQEKLQAAKKAAESIGKENKLLKEEVDAEEIAEVVSAWTGIPVKKMLQTEREKLLVLESMLQKRVVGQDEALEAVSDAVRRSRAGLQDPKRPIGSFLFLGSTGVGKTELAKALSEFMFNDEAALTRIDMSEYQERHSVSRLIGPPPGYVGFDDGGQLTEAVRTKPYSVILLDEIEKAHPDVYNILLQVLDDGRLTDSKGREINFKNTIIIMTSNLGSDIIQSSFENNSLDEAFAQSKKGVFEILKTALRPEFLNRIDELIVFRPLDRGMVKNIVRMQLAVLQKDLLEKNIRLECSEDAVKRLAELGYDPQYGARPIRRVIQRDVLNVLSKKLLAEEVLFAPDVMMLDCIENALIFVGKKEVNTVENP